VLHDDQLLVPLSVYVPGTAARAAGAPVSTLDVFTTIVDLIALDGAPLDLEGESLVPAIFQGKDNRERLVFAETRGPDLTVAAISDRYTLINRRRLGVYEIYDRSVDPLERRNLWGIDPIFYRLNAVLADRIDRGPFLRRAGPTRPPAWIVTSPAAPEHATNATVGGALRVIGWDAPAAIAGHELTITVYLAATQAVPSDYRVEAELAGARQSKVPAGDGIHPTSRWPVGQQIRESFELALPANSPPRAALSLRFFDALGRPASDPIVLGEIAIGPPRNP
jgi:hypothetical protein